MSENNASRLIAYLFRVSNADIARNDKIAAEMWLAKA